MTDRLTDEESVETYENNKPSENHKAGCVNIAQAQLDSIIEKLKQAVKDSAAGKDIDLEELYEVFCSIQNQAIAKSAEAHRKEIKEIYESKRGEQ